MYTRRYPNPRITASSLGLFEDVFEKGKQHFEKQKNNTWLWVLGGVAALWIITR